MCLLSKYLGLHKINGRKGEGAHCRVAVGEGLRASFGKNLDVLAIRFQVLFADGNLKVVAMIGRRYGRIPYGFYGRTEIFPGVSRREYKAEKERIGNCAMVVQPKTKSDLSAAFFDCEHLTRLKPIFQLFIQFFVNSFNKPLFGGFFVDFFKAEPGNAAVFVGFHG